MCDAHTGKLYHPLDLIGGDQIANFLFSGMQTKSDRKVEVFKTVIQAQNPIN
jgi:hypothetical protein